MWSVRAIDREAGRLAALRDLRLLDTGPSESFDRITRMASQLFDLPIAAVSLTDTDRQWFKSRVGVDHVTLPRDQAPCSAVAESGEVMVIEDIRDDPAYSDSPLARSGIRFYAGAPLTTANGFGLGAMCVLGKEPRRATGQELSALKDLAAMVMAQIELQHAFGRRDSISGLPNRIQFFEDLDDLARDQAGRARLAVVFDLIPVNQLSHTTRAMGLSTIDDMVKAAAHNLRDVIGAEGAAYHVGVAQLACLAPAELTEAEFRDRLIERTEDLQALGGMLSIGTRAIGVAPFILGQLASPDIMRMAQGAALDARAAGRLFGFHSSNQDSASQRSFKLLRDIEEEIRAPRNLRLVYQPRVETSTGRCTGVEALLRWTHPTLGAIPPGEFIPLVENSTLADQITAWVLTTAAAQLSAWRQAGLAVAMSVNISAANLRDPGLVASVRHCIDAHTIPPECLELEITETAVMSDAEQALATLERLASIGIRLAIDDFGTGYSSLAYLQRLPVDVVKIDRSFMQNLDTDMRQLSLVTMMIDMSKHLGHRVVAEGVETQQVLDCLRETACDELQGYLFARPMAADDFEAWYAGQTRPANRAARRRVVAPGASALDAVAETRP